MSRLVAQKLAQSLGQNVIVDNRPGGNTIIGSQASVNAPPDGYTLLFVTSTHTINPSVIETPYHAIRDFAPVSTVSRSPFGLVVHPSLPAENLRGFISLAKAKSGQLNYASSGIGTANHLAIELFSMVAAVKMNHIPYKGGGPALVDLIAGQVQLHMTVSVNLIPHIKKGTIIALAVTDEHRVAELPDVPTFAEAGLTRFNPTNWNGILAPAGTPKSIIGKLAAEIRKILQMPDVRAKLNAQGQDGWASKPEEFAALFQAEINTFAKVVKTTNIRND